ncbi:hypothetical protein PNEG_02787 [Pneumocystis murina B123]|uniref:Protein AF-9 homolog n=1 Tax=Pneumocystis murina (strain B123) TaxID=1069680 RepID=M7NP20_PNEMU|nr:hypothetical protein PNEG_02787 [Pneumocystis murina B123]EMR09012.1 hypothetical protein PNEG_02787 [Pneumocystis murina B123]
MAPISRVPKCQIIRPIVIGNIAMPLGDRKKPDSDHTHAWTVSVKGIYDEDLSYFIKKVVFKLHDTYPNATRTVDKSPFEVSETGWGEFDIAIRIYFVPEAAEKSISLFHRLKLHPYGPNSEIIREQGLSVTSYQYDEIIFNEPTEAMYDILTRHSRAVLPLDRSPTNLFSMI